MDIKAIFGAACLLWAVILTIAAIRSKGRCFVKDQEILGYVLIAVLYILGTILCIS